MKKLLILSVAVLLLASCDKDKGQCSVCTVADPSGITVSISQSARESKSQGNCTSTQAEFKQGLEDQSATGAVVTCVYE